MIIVGFMGIDVVIDIVINDILGDIAGCRRKIAAAPELAAPIAFSNDGKLLLYFTRGAAFHGTHEIGDNYKMNTSSV